MDFCSMSTIFDILVEASLSILSGINYQHHRNPCCKWSIPALEYMSVYDTLSLHVDSMLVFIMPRWVGTRTSSCVCVCVCVCACVRVLKCVSFCNSAEDLNKHLKVTSKI